MSIMKSGLVTIAPSLLLWSRNIPTSGLFLLQWEKTVKNRFTIHNFFSTCSSHCLRQNQTGCRIFPVGWSRRITKGKYFCGKEWSESPKEQAGAGLRNTPKPNRQHLFYHCCPTTAVQVQLAWNTKQYFQLNVYFNITSYWDLLTAAVFKLFCPALDISLNARFPPEIIILNAG